MKAEKSVFPSGCQVIFSLLLVLDYD